MTEQPDSFSPKGEEQPERTEAAGEAGKGDAAETSARDPEASSTSSTRSAEDVAAADADVDERTGLRRVASLERLRDRVEVTSREMKRLRRENQELAERVKELESRPAVEPHGTFLSLDHDPELLKRKISGFIEAIDDYLEKESKHG